MIHRILCVGARHLAAAVLGGALLAASAAEAPRLAPQVDAAPSRGELLYATHCIECHTQQIHWRDRKLARDWPTLREQVDRWQQAARLGWSDEDVDAATRHLAEAVYGFPQPQAQARVAARSAR
jgi:mono/diheme cytochrome c family protein